MERPPPRMQAAAAHPRAPAGAFVLWGLQSDYVGQRVLMSAGWRFLCVFLHGCCAPANYENVGRARFSPPHAADNAAQGPCSEAESHGADNQRPLGKGRSRRSRKPRLSDAQELELSFYLNAAF